jgi:hypothetical protein
MAGWYQDAEKYQLSSWILGSLENEIDSHVKKERERIISIAKRSICFDHLETKTCDHGGCYALDLLIGKLNEQLATN